jgi:hypothetical protein
VTAFQPFGGFPCGECMGEASHATHCTWTHACAACGTRECLDECTPAPRRGRPPVEDRRTLRVKFNAAEWAEVKRKADAAGMTGAAWVRMRCGV